MKAILFCTIALSLRTMFIFVAAALLVCGAFAVDVNDTIAVRGSVTGKCGKDSEYQLYGTGDLYIRGTGSMSSSNNKAPWEGKIDATVYRVFIEKDIQYIVTKFFIYDVTETFWRIEVD